MCRSRFVTPLIVPKLEAVGLSVGPEKTAWLKALKNSARYWSEMRSRIGVFFRIEKSTLFDPSFRSDANRVGNVRMFEPSCWAVLRLNWVTSNTRSTLRGFQLSGPPE